MQVLSATISERDVGGGEECVASVEWSEAIISCGGSVSQHVLTLTPFTSDCQSSGDCMVMGGSSVITTPGTQTQYSLTVTSQDYDITVRADTCGGSLTGDTSSLYNINLTGENIDECLNITEETLTFVLLIRKFDIVQCSLHVQSS